MSKRKDEIKSAITIAVEKRADKFEKGHPLFLPGLSLASALTVVYLIARWRGHNKALIAKGWSNPAGHVLALRPWHRLFLFKCRRSLSVSEIMNESKWLEEKYGFTPTEAIERTWPRYFFLHSYFEILEKRFPNFLDAKKLKKFFGPKQICLGMDSRRPVILSTECDFGSVLLTGRPGSGKSSLSHIIASQYKIEDVVVIGGKPGSFPGCKYVPVGSSRDVAQSTLDALFKIESTIKSRYQELAKYGVDSAARAPKEVQMPRQLVIFEECEEWLADDAYAGDKELKAIGIKIISTVNFILKQGRGARFLSLVVTQDLGKSALSVSSRQSSVTVSSQVSSTQLSQSVFGSSIAYSSSLVGGQFIILDRDGVRRFKAISPEYERMLMELRPTV
jgi:hypothetical protein